ncbi:subtilisin family serine protease [Leucobacter exalbidus]|uniref:Subtilisin family serine protease n=1 Tax=Leucobacter exalbidus TaxID=662960 RepID=A0A940T2J1_9MICO|nr:S8/S53 family peptidase [Leucobacter exalbidus]MBP1324858.1 subtilisin family serine protease [Leucobacter exalbidus]
MARTSNTRNPEGQSVGRGSSCGGGDVAHFRPRIRALLSAMVAVAVGFGLASTTAPIAAMAADDPRWWSEAIAIPSAHAQGLTGEGVKIAVIDDMIDPSSPAFTGANLTVNDDHICPESVGTYDGATREVQHGTAVTQMLVRPDGVLGLPGGIAPEAEVEFIAVGSVETCDALVRGEDGEIVDQWANAIDQAIADGADVISIAISTGASERNIPAIARALAAGVVVVGASPNESTNLSKRFASGINGVISVAAVNLEVDLLIEADGARVINKEITVVNAGVDIGVIGGTHDAPVMETTAGSSFATPLTAGIVALAMQKFPDATGNQIIQALIHSAIGSENGTQRDVTNGLGYGLASLPGILETDPMTYPDVNPLMDKALGQPTAEEVEALQTSKNEQPENETSAEPADEPAGESAEGTAPSAEAKPQESANPEGGLAGALLPWTIAGGIVVLGGIAVAVVMVGRKRRGQ